MHELKPQPSCGHAPYYARAPQQLIKPYIVYHDSYIPVAIMYGCMYADQCMHKELFHSRSKSLEGVVQLYLHAYSHPHLLVRFIPCMHDRGRISMHV